jgi:hypothetical protein
MMEDLRGIGIVLKWDTRTNDLRNEWSKHFDACHAPVTHENVTGVTDENVKNGGKHDKTTPVTDLSQPPVTACHEPVMAKTGTGTGTENNTQTFYSENPRAKKSENQNPRNEPPPNPKFAKFIHAAGMANFPSDLGKMLDLWERDGMDFDFTVIPAVERLAEKRRKDGGKQPYTASYLMMGNNFRNTMNAITFYTTRQMMKFRRKSPKKKSKSTLLIRRLKNWQKGKF